MGLKRTAYKIGFAVLLLANAPSSVAAEDSPLDPLQLNARYHIAWSGITIGRVVINAYEDDTSYRMTLDTKTKGLGALLNHEKNVITVTGTRDDAGEYRTTRYEFSPQKSDDDDHITLTYDANGELAERVRRKDDDPSWRAPVPVEEINTAHDPLTALFMLRRMLHEAIAINHHEVSTRTYDGMRLFDMKLTRLEDAELSIMGQSRELIATQLHRIPIKGYTPKELKKYKKSNPEIRFYFSNDAAFIPIRATARTIIGELTLTLDKIE